MPPFIHQVNEKTRFTEIRKTTEAICDPLKTEDYVVQPMMDASPPKWHLAHTTWFWEEFVLSRFYPNYKRFHPRYSFLFNSYYDAVGERVLRAHRGNLSRPTVSEIFEYRKYVDAHMEMLWDNLPEGADSIISLGLHHEQQHQELLYTDIKYILGHNPLFPVYKSGLNEFLGSSGDGEFITMPEDMYIIGHSSTGFCFDNECPAHPVFLQSFSICTELVKNDEYLHFMEGKGYETPSLWHSDGYAWAKENEVTAPLYWHNIEGEWCRYSLAGLTPVKPDNPVSHISFYEASAFAAWSGHRLPTEFEWEAAAPNFSWGGLWEHTNSAYLPYPGYTRPSGAIGEYNGKFMINQMVLRGASGFTPNNHARITYRNFFYPNQRWQFTGIRLCRNPV
jgi:ergothioneine biosynthesis protein EgtB